jgi:hypothetical protein
MPWFDFARIWSFFTSRSFALGLLWTAFAALAIALLLLVNGRWGRSEPLKKCLILSVLAHLWIAGFLTTLRIAFGTPSVDCEVTQVFLDDFAGPDARPGDKAAHPAMPSQNDAAASMTLELPPAVEPPALPTIAAPIASSPASRATALPDDKRLPDLAEVQPTDEWHARPARDLQPKASSQAKLESPKPEPGKPDSPKSVEPANAAIRPLTGPFEPLHASPSQEPLRPLDETAAGGAGSPKQYLVPSLYRLRNAPDRAAYAQRAGANEATEAAVRSALKWMGASQEADGRWDARKHGAGVETLEAGHDRESAGRGADTGVTGLAILALAATGNTHREGDHQQTVRKAVDYLLRNQGPDGNLGGQAQVYEFTYCHGMATLALAEILGMSGDAELREPVERAIGYTLAAQDPVGGGWRYRPRDPGDTSQLGWQVMALKSAELAGIRIPKQTWQGVVHFLNEVASGERGGLASYRSGEQVSRTMTAEALLCRLFLGQPIDSPATEEARDLILGRMPGDGEANLYCWYYGTMSMYQLQGPNWTKWSEAIQRTLLTTQETSGPLAGSWPPNTRWDSYGGRVYSTSLATLCLETYYRFVPLQFVERPGSGSPR